MGSLTEMCSADASLADLTQQRVGTEMRVGTEIESPAGFRHGQASLEQIPAL